MRDERIYLNGGKFYQEATSSNGSSGNGYAAQSSGKDSKGQTARMIVDDVTRPRTDHVQDSRIVAKERQPLRAKYRGYEVITCHRNRRVGSPVES